MLYDLERFRQTCDRGYSADDITMIVAVRAHDDNPWVLQRLQILAGYYRPAPRCIIVDFGSAEPHRSELRRTAEEAGFEYVFVDDDGVFTLAKARNVGASHARTDLLFFSDIDCFGTSDLCARLASHANAIGLSTVFDQIIKMPVYHLGERVSSKFLAADAERRSPLLDSFLAESIYSGVDTISEFVDPSSNFFVCRREFYDLVGGYNEAFRGHGSEDYEFLVRFALCSGQFPMPLEPGRDEYGPRHGSFYGSKLFRGFRRLGELMSFHAEVAGLRIAHLYHPRPKAPDGWYENNDWKRTRFADQVNPILRDPKQILSYDWMPREKSALVLVKHAWHYEFFLPLRRAGYRLVMRTHEQLSEDTSALDMIVNRRVDAVAIFNPYMKSHTELRPYFECAKTSGVETIVIERGALPESWYYATDVSYADPEWSLETLEAFAPTSEETAIATEYVSSLRRGEHTLEKNGSMSRTLARYSVYGRLHPKICFIPMQIDDDLAVTRFADGFIDYAAFRDSILAVAERRPDVLFLIKPHPLSKSEWDSGLENVVICRAEDNVHALIETAHAVVCYNSGVGLLGLLHGKRVVTLGNAFYNFPGLGKRARDADEAVRFAFETVDGFLERDVTQLVAWMLFRKYSFFKADSHYRDFGTRRSHEYRNMRCYKLNFRVHDTWLLARVSRPFSESSYASGRLGVPLVDDDRKKSLLPRARNEGRVALLQKKLRKLQRNPQRFFADSSLAPLRWIGRAVATNGARR